MSLGLRSRLGKRSYNARINPTIALLRSDGHEFDRFPDHLFGDSDKHRKNGG